MADALSRHVSAGSVFPPIQTPTIQNISLHELASAQRQDDVWSQLIHALESGDDTTLHVPLSQFFLTPGNVLGRY